MSKGQQAEWRAYMDREEWEEIEEKKEYLKGYRKAKQREQMLLEQIQKLRLDTMMPSINNDGMPHGSGGESDLSDYMEKMEELNGKLKAELEETAKEYDKIYESLKRMKNDDEREVLTRYYLMKEKWEDIAKKIGYSRSGAFNIYDRAIRNFKIL